MRNIISKIFLVVCSFTLLIATVSFVKLTWSNAMEYPIGPHTLQTVNRNGYITAGLDPISFKSGSNFALINVETEAILTPDKLPPAAGETKDSFVMINVVLSGRYQVVFDDVTVYTEQNPTTVIIELGPWDKFAVTFYPILLAAILLRVVYGTSNAIRGKTK